MKYLIVKTRREKRYYSFVKSFNIAHEIVRAMSKAGNDTFEIFEVNSDPCFVHNVFLPKSEDEKIDPYYYNDEFDFSTLGR